MEHLGAVISILFSCIYKIRAFMESVISLRFSIEIRRTDVKKEFNV
jgi:hypothetical protein